jgi:DNA polymerase-3 subunit delta
MVAIKAHEADRALAKPDPAWRLVLIYGPDAGLVSERAAALARASVDDANDAFQLVRMDGDDVASDPLKLVDEANTIGLFGGRRAIRVSPTSKPLLAAVEPLLATRSGLVRCRSPARRREQRSPCPAMAMRPAISAASSTR